MSTRPPASRFYREDLAYYEGRAVGLLASAEDGTAGAVAAFQRWSVAVGLDGARTVLAREHGLESWAALRRHLKSLRVDDDPFARAYRALEAHDVGGLREELDRFPDIVAARGTNGNDLLGMASATCDERLVGLLLERGADPGRSNVHGWTPLHQAAQSGLALLTRRLLDADAPVHRTARGDGGTPLIAALFWGKRETAELLADRGMLPPNLRVAAGLGRLDMIDRLVTADPAAGTGRGFYRPHSGFPAWQPRPDHDEILSEALSWAARNDRPDAVEALIAHGARPDADVYRGTALAWAAACGHPATIDRLLALGADPNARTTFGGPDHGDGATALHLAAQGGHLAAIDALLDADADPAIRDARYQSTPAGWAEHCGKDAAHDLLRTRGG